MITDKQIDGIAIDFALNEIFSNVGEEGWPDDPMGFLYQRMHGNNTDSPDEMIPWVPFENEDTDRLLEIVDNLIHSFTHAVIEVLNIERG